jgi:hypothetical protein
VSALSGMSEAQRGFNVPYSQRRPSLERLWSIQRVLYTTGILGSHCTVKGDVCIVGMSQRKVKATCTVKEMCHARENVLECAQ